MRLIMIRRGSCMLAYVVIGEGIPLYCGYWNTFLQFVDDKP